MQITPSQDQQQAIEDIMSWYDDYQRGESPSQIYTLAGYAGTGKSTIAAYIRDQIPGHVAYISFTGKAANVLRTKLEAQGVLQKDDHVGTIHSLIYIPYFDDNKLKFKKREELNSVADLIIVDEASMVGVAIFQDLLSYGIPILFIGDNAQLPPIKDLPGVRLSNPDFQLTKIHRQAEGNPIIRFASNIREGKFVMWGNFADNVVVLDGTREAGMHKVMELKHAYKADTDIFLCGFNRTRVNLNQELREILGFEGKTPLVGDRVICLKNNKKKGIFNGMLGIITDISEITKFNPKKSVAKSFTKDILYYTIEIDFDGLQYRGIALADQFGNTESLYDLTNLIYEESHILFDLFDYGYCISTHKSQGSEFKNVVVFREQCRVWNQRQWDYTAVTRAVDSLYMVY